MFCALMPEDLDLVRSLARKSAITPSLLCQAAPSPFYKFEFMASRLIPSHQGD
jgi:hypothetical protein